MQRKDYTVALNLQTAASTTPTRFLREFYGCGANMQLGWVLQSRDRQAGRPAIDARPTRRSASSWYGQIERKLAEDDVRPIIYYTRGGTCWQPEVKGLTIMVNSIYNGWRMEDVWLDK